jgi:hypothetical protein
MNILLLGEKHKLFDIWNAFFSCFLIVPALRRTSLPPHQIQQNRRVLLGAIKIPTRSVRKAKNSKGVRETGHFAASHLSSKVRGTERRQRKEERKEFSWAPTHSKRTDLYLAAGIQTQNRKETAECHIEADRIEGLRRVNERPLIRSQPEIDLSNDA